MASTKVKDQFKDPNDFRVLLEQAARKVENSKEEDFVADLASKFETYGSSMYFSENQSRWLCSIAVRI